MARSMGEDEGYRAAVKIRTIVRDPDGGTKPGTAINYFGPWARAATAKAEVTKARRYYKSSFIDGWIESASWSRVD